MSLSADTWAGGYGVQPIATHIFAIELDKLRFCIVGTI
jgi:hypothetical protein